MSEEQSMRVRSILNRWLGAIAIACLLIAGAGAVLAHGAYVDPGTHQEQRVVDEWGVNGSFSHGATVRDPTDGTPFEDGATVRDRNVYFQRVMPVLSGEFRFRTPGADAPVNLTIERRLVVESVEAGSGEERSTVYWRDTRPLGTNQTTKQPEAVATAPFELNVTRTVAEARNVSERLDSPGQIRTRVLVALVATRQTGEAETRQLTYALRVDTERGVYRVASTPSTEQFTDTETVTVPNEPSALQRFGGPLLLLVGVIGSVGLVVGRFRGATGLSEREREWLAYRDDRADFDEWITAVGLPDEAGELPTAEAETLGDLVDLAIDTDSAVVESPSGNAYYVVHDGYRYRYVPPAGPTDSDPAGVVGSQTETSANADSGDGSEPTGDDQVPIADGTGNENHGDRE